MRLASLRREGHISPLVELSPLIGSGAGRKSPLVEFWSGVAEPTGVRRQSASRPTGQDPVNVTAHLLASIHSRDPAP